MSKLTVVGYHYVRDLKSSRYPVKGRDISEFINQLDFFSKNYNFISAYDLIRNLTDNHELPPNPILLSFDDGLIDHYINVLPILEERKIKGVFFPSVDSVNGKILPVHKIQLILAAIGRDELIEVLEYYTQSNSLSDYWKYEYIANGFDDDKLTQAKQMLQCNLPEAHRTYFINNLFSTYAPEIIASDIYMTKAQLKLMVTLGHYVGNHTVSHDWIRILDPETQKTELIGGLEFMSSIGIPTNAWIMCYPYGIYDSSFVELARENGCVCGFTADRGISNLVENPLEMARFDTNNFPV